MLHAIYQRSDGPANSLATIPVVYITSSRVYFSRPRGYVSVGRVAGYFATFDEAEDAKAAALSAYSLALDSGESGLVMMKAAIKKSPGYSSIVKPGRQGLTVASKDTTRLRDLIQTLSLPPERIYTIARQFWITGDLTQADLDLMSQYDRRREPGTPTFGEMCKDVVETYSVDTQLSGRV